MTEDEREAVAQRVIEYDPEQEVAVLFGFKGQVGLNVIRPIFPPRAVFEQVRGKR